MWRAGTIAVILCALAANAGRCAEAQTRIAALDLAAPFKARAPWRLVALQGPAETGVMDEPEPGKISLCLSRGEGQACQAPFTGGERTGKTSDAWPAQYLNELKLVYPGGPKAPPLLLATIASAHGGNGDQAVFTRLFAYRPAADRFEQVFGKVVGRNNNQEVRYMADGPLKGAVVAAEPTSNAPYGYWITVHRLTADYNYAQTLRYRSGVRYGDGNALKVIDSEMPEIERRLGLWRPGEPMPTPPGCAKPHLVRKALWCN